MKTVFVQTENVKRFLAATAAVEARGAPEACFLLATGDAGYGKTRTGNWWAVQHNAALIRVKTNATANWILHDLVTELGEVSPAHSVKALFGQAVAILARDPRPIVLDEVENAIKGDCAPLETIRGVTDFCEVPAILIGRRSVKAKLMREPQIWTRISAMADFGPASLGDVEQCCAELTDVKIDPAVAVEIHARAEGHIREVVKAVANVERAGQRTGGKPVTLDDIDVDSLCQDWQRTGRRKGSQR